MIMRTIGPVVAYCMQICMYNFTGMAIVMAHASNGVLYRGCGPLCYIGKSWTVLESYFEALQDTFLFRIMIIESDLNMTT